MTSDLPEKPSARRSHPPSLIRLAERLIEDEKLVEQHDIVLCACSGGPDSTALLHVMALLQRRLGHRVIAVGIDHGLRGNAPAELALARDLAGRFNVPFLMVRVEVSPGSNLQARARAARFEALAAAAATHGVCAIATGHTADDRAETFLLRLLRGAGPLGLAVLPARAPFPQSQDQGHSLHLIRPLLLARRTDVLAHLNRHRIAFALDPSNQDPRFTRVRVRQELLPLLESLSPKIVAHLCVLADILAKHPQPLASHLSLLKSLPVNLGRAQRLAIERALLQGKPAQLRVKGHRDISVTLSQDGDVIVKDSPGHRRE